ncbi:hypothetical protein C8J57DRAFT_1269797 [Mycena rebaudengoi]|nr:hypothetical protein C8J57DRAFT_1269797 [Mycena rebaudengoi]
MASTSLAQVIPYLPSPDQEFLARVRDLRLPGVTATHSGPPRMPDAKAMSEHFKRVVDAWIPHPFTPQEFHTARCDAFRYLVIAKQIEEVQRELYPQPLPIEVQGQLLFARKSYLLRYFRTFRINELPTEILCNILRFVVWDSMKRPVEARLRVTWTCKLWREIAITDSTLWNAIWFRGTGPQIERAWTWFERARLAPLDVRIDDHRAASLEDDSDEDDNDGDSLLPGRRTSMSGPQMRRLCERLFQKIATIRMLIIVVDEWASALVVLDMLRVAAQAGLPMLQRFELHRGGLKKEDMTTFSWPDVVTYPFLGGVVAPSLAYLSLNGVAVDWSRSVFQNLTTFDIRRLPFTHSPSAARFREILASCPGLQKLSMDGAGPQYEEQDPSQIVPVELPHLRTLVIADFTRQYSMFLFAQFSAPNVNDLTLMNLCGDNYLPLFIQLTSAFPKVQLLTTYSIQFEVSPYGSATMTRWLDSMPLLSYLRVANVASSFFGTFFRTDDTPQPTPVAPKLATADCQSIPTEMLVQWATDRAKHGAPLRKIYVSEELGLRLSQDQTRILASICMLAKLPRGATTPEEEALSL